MLYHWTRKIQVHIEPRQCIAVEWTSFTRGPTVYTGSKNQRCGIGTTAQASHKPTSSRSIKAYNWIIWVCLSLKAWQELLFNTVKLDTSSLIPIPIRPYTGCKWVQTLKHMPCNWTPAGLGALCSLKSKSLCDMKNVMVTLFLPGQLLTII